MARPRTGAGAWFGVFLLLLAAAGLVWLSRHPESPLLEAAAEWPLIGPAAARFRHAYLPPPPPPVAPPAETAPEPEVEIVWLFEPMRGEKRLHKVPEVLATGDEVWVEEGAILRSAPEPAAAVAGRSAALANLPVLERLQGWARVRWRDEEVWVEAGEDEAAAAPPLGSGLLPAGPLPARPADPGRLAAASKLLGSSGRKSLRAALGPYPLLTDVADPRLLLELEVLVLQLEPLYAQRYGLVPLGEPAETILLFAREESYRRYQGREERLVGRVPTGHAGFGIVSLWTEERGIEEIGSTLLHELTHLLNRRAIGPALPPWLEEGLAEDLAGAARDPQGRVLPGTFGGTILRSPQKIEIRGARALVGAAASAFAEGRSWSLDRLLAATGDGFGAGEDGPLRYAECLLFVRYLLDGDRGRRAPGFRRFLAGVAAGASPSIEALREALGEEPVALEPAFRAWVAMQVAASRGEIAGETSR